MAVQPQTPYKEYTANGSTNSFALEFDCDNQDHLIVLVDDVEPVVGTWSLSAGAVVFGIAPTTGKKITVQRNTPASRSTNYKSSDNSFRPDPINKDFDRIWLKLQELGVADMLLRIYVDRLHIEQKDYIDNQDLIIKNIVSDLRNYVDQQDGALSNDIGNLRTYVNQQDNNQKTYFENLINQQGMSLSQLNDYYNHLLQGIANIAVNKGWLASLVVDASGKNQQEINNRLPEWNNPKEGLLNTIINNAPLVKNMHVGVIEFNPAKQIDVIQPIEINQARFNFDGNNSILKWVLVSQVRSVIEVFDSQHTRISDFIILGDKTNPPLAGIHFKNSTVVALSSNNRCSVENVIIGKRYRNDTAGGGSVDEPITNVENKVQNGILATKDGRGNNDEFWLNNVVVHGATTAGFNFDGEQHIWSSISNSLANSCVIGYRMGSNMTLFNMQSNRCSVADMQLIRDVQVNVFSMNAEHSECFANSKSGGSCYIQGGELQTNKNYDIPFFKFENGGDLIVRDQFIENIGTGSGYIEYSDSSTKSGKVKIETTYLQGGNLRDTYRIHTATNTYKPVTINIDNGDFFKFKTEFPYHDKAITAATTVNANGNARLIAGSTSKNGAGKLRINTINQHIDGVRLIDCLTDSIVDIRAVNTIAANVTFSDIAKVRSLRLDDRITNKIKVTRALGVVNASSYKNLSVNMGARVLDHFAITADFVSGLASMSLSAQAKSDGTVTIIAENMLAANITSIPSLALTVAKLDLSKFNLKTLHELPTDILVNVGQTVFIDIPLENCQMGGHTSIASSFYADGLIYSSSVKSNGVVSVAIANKSSVAVTIPTATIFSVICAF